MVKYFSGLVTEPDVSGLSDFGKFKSALDITNNLKKIRALPSPLSEAILGLPQFEIIFEGQTPFYLTEDGRCELPKRYGERYYDPVEDTEAFKLVIDEVRAEARAEADKELLKRFGTTRVMGGVHVYYGIEARIMYEKYGITYINNPMTLNLGLHID